MITTDSIEKAENNGQKSKMKGSISIGYKLFSFVDYLAETFEDFEAKIVPAKFVAKLVLRMKDAMICNLGESERKMEFGRRVTLRNFQIWKSKTQKKSFGTNYWKDDWVRFEDFGESKEQNSNSDQLTDLMSSSPEQISVKFCEIK